MKETQTEKLARWANTLNGWEWPNDLPGKPENFESLPVIIRNGEEWTTNQHEIISGLMGGIEEIIGHKEFLRWHHTHNLNHTNEEFETWWKGKYREE